MVNSLAQLIALHLLYIESILAFSTRTTAFKDRCAKNNFYKRFYLLFNRANSLILLHNSGSYRCNLE